jgi:hypothetical protein
VASTGALISTEQVKLPPLESSVTGFNLAWLKSLNAGRQKPNGDKKAEGMGWGWSAGGCAAGPDLQWLSPALNKTALPLKKAEPKLYHQR